MDEQHEVADNEQVAQSNLQLVVRGISLEQVRDEQQIDELAFVERLRAQVSFQLSDPTGNQAIIDELSYYIQILAYNLATDQTEVLTTDHQRLHAGQSDYTHTVEFARPKVGHYKLLGTVLLPASNAVGVALGPVLRIIPG